MSRTITVGVDDSPESRAAADWAAREARLRRLPLKVVHVREPTPRRLAQTPLLDLEGYQRWAGRLTRDFAQDALARHPGIEVVTEQLTGNVADELCAAAGSAEMIVLGSRGLSGLRGFMVGSVSQGVVARAERPVVLVRAGQQAAGAQRTDTGGLPSTETPSRPVVLGLDMEHPDDTLLGFAFDAAAFRKAALRVVHAWPDPATSYHQFPGGVEVHDTFETGQAVLLGKVLRPWRQKFPDVEVIEASRCGSPQQVLVDSAGDASLVVVGRRIRTGAFTGHIGHVAHSALHHIAAPVAIVAHN
ncbi:universal stress protein [Streptomyces anandii]|uniref:universal stress protein n=1 Tax=Streptomyces anandii TaxID=285454 RepID=UPI00167937F6|nr:universal stress protein [Streptomyces anandii]GGX98292.1 stress-inducible protein [Streptomyces anandii JCM 4720]